MSLPQEFPSAAEAAARRRRSAWHLRRPSIDFYGWLDRQALFRPLILVAMATGVGLLLTPELLAPEYPASMVEGMVASQNSKAPYDLDVLDEESTERLRSEAAEHLRRVYDFDALIAERTQARLAEAFTAARLAAATPTPSRPEDSAASRRAQFEKILGQSLRSDEYAVLRAARFGEEVQAALQRLVQVGQSAPMVAHQDALEQDRGTGMVLQRVPSDGRQGQVFDSVAGIGDVDSARITLHSRTAALLHDLPLSQQLPLTALAARLLEPNVSLNRAETERQRSEARQSVKAVSLAVKKGEMIIRDGERLTHRHLLILDALRQHGRGNSWLLVALGGAAILLVLIVTAARFAQGYGQRWVLHARDLLFLAVVFFICLGSARIWLSMTHSLHEAYPSVPLWAFVFAAPLAAGTMMVRLVLRAEVALLFSLISSLMLGLLADSDRMLGIYALVGSVVATSAIRSISARSDLLKAGVWVGLAQAGTALGIFLFGANDQLSLYAVGLPAAFIGGLACGFVALSLTPLVEWTFGYTTDLKLLELSNLNHPALKELIVQAPGSYHHSIIVGALVEAAAESIGANPLLARVMAYYHDLGKGCNPVYFVENQRSHHNPHDKLKPSMSAMIIRRHVTDGIELAKQYALGEPILAGIAQHHGTTLIHYFYHKAREQAADSDSVSEAEYRYPGQKPQTREAALVMVGDSIEAAARSLSDPTPARLQGLVTRIISHKFTDGQLEECDLTLRDLHTIAKAFSRVLTSIYHHRVEYPDMLRPVSGRKASVDSDHKPKRGAEAAHTPTAQDPPDNLRRLGL